MRSVGVCLDVYRRGDRLDDTSWNRLLMRWRKSPHRRLSSSCSTYRRSTPARLHAIAERSCGRATNRESQIAHAKAAQAPRCGYTASAIR